MKARERERQDRDLRDEYLLGCLENLYEPNEWMDGFATADMVQRMARDAWPMTVPGVGRVLARLARAGRCEIRYADGSGQYRCKPPPSGPMRLM